MASTPVSSSQTTVPNDAGTIAYLGASKPKVQTFSITIKDIQKNVSYEQLFAYGHELWLARKYVEATAIFEKLAEVKDRGPRAAILLAHCYAMEQHFSDCSRTLSLALPSDECGMMAAELHDIFVLWKCTFFKDVRRELESFVEKHPELPTPTLLLADFFLLAGRREQALQYLELAIKRDRNGGAVQVAAIAQRNLLLKKMASKGETKPSP